VEPIRSASVWPTDSTDDRTRHKSQSHATDPAPDTERDRTSDNDSEQ
jgi:hypothetical protein